MDSVDGDMACVVASVAAANPHGVSVEPVRAV